jgi:opacity protein-like surface antigen
MMPRNEGRRLLFMSTCLAMSSLVMAQTVVTPDNTVMPMEEAAPSQLIQNRNIEVQPVVVSPGMDPNVVPRQSDSGRSMQMEGASGLSVSGAATGVSGNNPGNANTGGVQVQNVTVQANPELDQTAATGYSAVDSLKKRREMFERDNESRLIEKIEEGRLMDERERARTVEQVNSSFASSAAAAAAAGDGSAAAAAAASSGGTQVVPVIAVAQAQSESPNMKSEAAYKGNNNADSTFRVSPFVGKRWLYDGYAEFNAWNIFTTGVTMQGRMASYIGLEGSFMYGRDEFTYGSTCGAYTQQCGYINDMRTRDTYEFGANLIVGPQDKKLRPYGLIGLGVMYNAYNIDDEYTKQALESIGWKRATTHFFNNFGGGLDYQLSKSFAVGGRVDYQYVYGEQSEMDRIWGDNRNSLRGSANLTLQF